MPQIQVLVLSGEVSNDVVVSVVEFARNSGFVVNQHTIVGSDGEPSLSEILQATGFTPSRLTNRGWVNVDDLNNEPLSELLDLTWDYYAGPPDGIQRLFKVMAERLLAFSDADLAALRRQDLATLNIDVRPAAILDRSGIKSVELLRFCTGAQLLDLRNFGQNALEEVRAKLAVRELKLRGDT